MLNVGSRLSVPVGLTLFCVFPLQSLLGKPMRRDLKFTSRQIQPSWSFSISPTKSKKTISKRNKKTVFWKRYSLESPFFPLSSTPRADGFVTPLCSMVGRNTWTPLRESFCWLRQRSMWSILVTGLCWKDRRRLWPVPNTRRMCSLITTW